MRRPRGRIGAVAIACAGVAVALSGCPGNRGTGESPSPSMPTTPTSPAATSTVPRAERPSIVVILTDDQRFDTVSAMPIVQRELVDRGVLFTNAFAVNPVCCPSRATLLTGQYSHSNGIYRNNPPDGGFEDFDDASTIATWLDGAEYRTSLVGKYLNGYNFEQVSYVPPGWDHWFAFTSTGGNGTYLDYEISSDGDEVAFGDTVSDYSTDVLTREAVSFIRTADREDPLFLLFAPKAPHLPAFPAPRHQQAFSDIPPARPPSFDEADMSDKPSYMQQLDRLTIGQIAQIDELRRDQLRTLLAVDEAVGEIVEALQDTGRLDRTMIVFTSDNGWLWGEHRRERKSVPYEESIRVPLVIRYDPLVREASTDDRLIANIDLAPTFAALAGVPAPEADGRSLLPLLLPDGEALWRADFLVEHLGAGATYCGVRSTDFIYVIYRSGEEELYDLEQDPFQLENLAAESEAAATLETMRGRVRELCVPPPPGVVPK